MVVRVALRRFDWSESLQLPLVYHLCLVCISTHASKGDLAMQLWSYRFQLHCCAYRLHWHRTRVVRECTCLSACNLVFCLECWAGTCRPGAGGRPHGACALSLVCISTRTSKRHIAVCPWRECLPCAHEICTRAEYGLGAFRLASLGSVLSGNRNFDQRSCPIG